MAGIPLTIAIADAPHTAALKSGAIPIAGIAPQFVNIVPQIAAFRRMVRDHEFDVCELAPTTYFIARSLGAPFIALPIFLMRRFHHAGLLVRPDAGIEGPKDLEGKRVGVRAYSVTTAVWTRAVLAEEYGLDNSAVTWVVDDEEHVAELKLPKNVMRAPRGKSLAAMMAAGEIDAGLAGNAGIGRSGSPSSARWQREAADYPPLFENAARLEAEWYAKTRIYPIHGTLVVKDAVLAKHPWVARALFDAFSRAKSEWLEQLQSGAANSATDLRYRALSRIVGDPLPFGMEANMASIRALQRAAHSQGLTAKPLPLTHAFADVENT